MSERVLRLLYRPNPGGREERAVRLGHGLKQALKAERRGARKRLRELGAKEPLMPSRARSFSRVFRASETHADRC